MPKSAPPNQQIGPRLKAAVSSLLQEAVRTSWMLFRIMIPISIVTRILAQAGVVDRLGTVLTPVMRLVGLPGSMGLVWATSMVVNMYGGMVVFAAVAPGADLTVAQVTVLTTMVLMAHTLPVEVRIAQKAGASAWCILVLRVVSALVLGMLLHWLYTGTQTLQAANAAVWNPSPPPESWRIWAFGEARNLLAIFVIILVLLTTLQCLKLLGVTTLLAKLLRPVLAMIGVSQEAAPLAIAGITLGITYGGGLIIREAQSGRLAARDVFFSVALMSLFHSLFEDTLLMVVLGGHLSGILWARMAFSLVTVALLAKFLAKMPDPVFRRWFCRRACAFRESR